MLIYIALISISVWIAIPFFHRKKYYFYFFLHFAILDIINLVCYILDESSTEYYAPFSILVLWSVRPVQLKKYYLYFLLFGAVLFVLSHLTTYKYQYLFTAIVHSAIFFIVSTDFLKLFTKKNILNLFLFVLLLYELSAVLKLLIVAKDISVGAFYWYITNGLQLFIGLFFIIFQEDSRKIILKLKND